MANSSIYDVFERMWKHVLTKFNSCVPVEAFDHHISNTENPHYVTKEQIGLDSVDNTSDMDKPISDAVQAALDEKADVYHDHDNEYCTKDELSEMFKPIATSPRNLLDNSDFTNPVNQRGQTVFNVNNGMSIDRWSIGSSAESFSLSIGANGLTATSFTGWDLTFVAEVRQRLPKGIISLDKKYTLAAYYAGEGVRIGTLESTHNAVDPDFFTSNSAFDAVNIYIRKGETLVWAALYEGEYTVETLPEYQPKGYGVELVECLRYYQRYENFAINCISDEYKKGNAFFYLPTPMRIIPTVTFSTISNGDAYNGTKVLTNGSVFGILIVQNYTSKDCIGFSYNGSNMGTIIEFKSDLLELSAEL